MSERFVNQLRSRPDAVQLVADGALPAWVVRVQAAEVWDAVRVDVVPQSLVREVKQAAMAQLMPDVDRLNDYVVKVGGIEIDNENDTLEDAGVVDGSTLLVMSRRRRPVR